MRTADAIRNYRRTASIAKVVIYGLLYALPFVVIRDRTLRTVLVSLVPLLIVVCAGVVLWSSDRSQALQHKLNVKLEDVLMQKRA